MNPHNASVFPDIDEIPEEFRLGKRLEQRSYLCDGEIRQWDGPFQDVLSPICTVTPSGPARTSIGSYPLLSGKQSGEALNAALRSQDGGRGAWPTMPVEKRIGCLSDFAARMMESRDEVVRRMMWEIGKSLSDSRKEFDRTVEYVRDTIEALKDLDRASSRFVMEQGVIGQIRRAPLGVVLCMGPFNYPLNETLTTLIPALVMGNSVIFKPPKLGVLLHEPLLAAFRDCFPRGVVNTVYGDGRTVVGPLMESGAIDVLAFIGTSRVADLLRRQHPKPHRLRCVLGLEAKNAGIVLSDADLDTAVRECVLGALSFNGQRCTALKMLFVHRDILESFMGRFVEAVGRLKAGMPWDEGVQITPLPEDGKVESMKSLIGDAVSKGASIAGSGGGDAVGTLMNPAVVYPVGPGMRLYTEEQFGPVVPVAAFDSIEEPLKWIAESDFGQQVSLFGRDPEVIASLVDPLVNQVCRVNINSQCQRGPDTFPFTGRKDSAEGTLSVTDALRVFTIRTLVAARETDDNRRILKSIVTGRSSRFISTDFIF